jgi:hypothetical protein
MDAFWVILTEINETKKNRGVKSVTALQMERCLESYPCQGHKGVLVTFDDGAQYSSPCSSVTIGLVQKFYFPKEETHFTGYVTAKMDMEMNRD